MWLRGRLLTAAEHREVVRQQAEEAAAQQAEKQQKRDARQAATDARKAEKEAAAAQKRGEQVYTGAAAQFHGVVVEKMFKCVLERVCQNRQLTVEQREAQQKRIDALRRKRGREN